MSVAQGQRAENAAADYLSAAGYKIIARNYHTQRGEIDIIACHDDTLVFVEVKMRGSHAVGSGRDYVHKGKQRRIILSAQHYLTYTSWEGPCRFDVIEIQGAENPSLSHIPNAFECD